MIIGVFAALFIISTIWVRDVKEGTVHQILGHEPNVGADFSYGLPLVFMSFFRPYDTSAQSLYNFPMNFNLQNFMVDFILWLAVATVLVLVVERLRTRRTTP
jgi:hypothetical protein